MKPVPWLLLGMLCGLSLAIFSLFRPQIPNLPPSIVASVNAYNIPRAELEQALKGIEDARRVALTPADEQDVLNRLIDEQLLLSYGLELDLVRQNPMLRKQLVSTVLELQRGQTALQQPQSGELESFFRANQSFFAAADELRVRVYRHANAEPLRQQQAALQGAEMPKLSPDAAIPDRLLPQAKLYSALGAELYAQIEALKPGESSPIVRLKNSFAFVHLIQRKPGRIPVFSSVKSQVEQEWRRRQGEQQLNALLAELRQRYPVSIAP